MRASHYILCFEDFYYEDESLVNEANQDSIKKLQNAKAHYAKRADQIKKKQQEVGEILNKIKEREGKTKDPLTAKIYQARSSEEGMKQELYNTRLQAIQQAAKIVDQKLTVANLRLQAKAKRQAKP